MSEEIFCETESDITHNSGRRIIQGPGAMYKRQECWIIKMNPGREWCWARQSVGRLGAEWHGRWYNCHQMWAQSSVVTESGECPCAGLCWTWVILISDPYSDISVITRREALTWWLWQITSHEIDYIPPRGVSRSPLRCLCCPVCVLINYSSFIGCGEACRVRLGLESDSQYVGQILWIMYLLQVARHCPDHHWARRGIWESGGDVIIGDRAQYQFWAPY